MHCEICVTQTGRRWRRIYPHLVSYTQTSQVSRYVYINEVDWMDAHRLIAYIGYREEQGSPIYCKRHPSTPSGRGDSTY